SGSTLSGREPASTVVTTGQCTAQNPQYPATVRLVSALMAPNDRDVSIPAPGSLPSVGSVRRYLDHRQHSVVIGGPERGAVGAASGSIEHRAALQHPRHAVAAGDHEDEVDPPGNGRPPGIHLLSGRGARVAGIDGAEGINESGVQQLGVRVGALPRVEVSGNDGRKGATPRAH